MSCITVHWFFIYSFIVGRQTIRMTRETCHLRDIEPQIPRQLSDLLLRYLYLSVSSLSLKFDHLIDHIQAISLDRYSLSELCATWTNCTPATAY